jgi:CheY-like chemotaxis protein
MKLTRACTVLIVEQDAAVREAVTTMLRDQDLLVQSAASGSEAIALCGQAAGNIGMVLLDVGMEPMDGPQTLRELQRIDPRVLCCFMTGGFGKHDNAALKAVGVAYVFQKPFQASEVANVLKRLAPGLTADDTGFQA